MSSREVQMGRMGKPGIGGIVTLAASPRASHKAGGSIDGGQSIILKTDTSLSGDQKDLSGRPPLF